MLLELLEFNIFFRNCLAGLWEGFRAEIDEVGLYRPSVSLSPQSWLSTKLLPNQNILLFILYIVVAYKIYFYFFLQ